MPKNEKPKIWKLKGELRHFQKNHERKYTKKLGGFSSCRILSDAELESVKYISWLEGYIEAIKDERGLK